MRIIDWSSDVCSSDLLKPAMRRPNLTVWTRALTTRVLIENGRAVGVELAKSRERVEVRAQRGVILSGGANNSPQVLLLSGVGPADELKAQGVSVVHDLPGVGKNLQDHLEVYVQHACTQPITLYSALKPWNQAMIGISWILFKTGLGASSHFEIGRAHV